MRDSLSMNSLSRALGGPFLRMLFWVLFCCGTLIASEALRDHALVVYNLNTPESEAIAQEYAKLRGIPSERLLGLECSRNEEISRSEFDETILKPLERQFLQKNWIQRFKGLERFGTKVFELKKSVRNEIWVMILIHGMPLKIANEAQNQDLEGVLPAINTNGAAIDSELALFPIYGLPKTGLIPNAFYQKEGGSRYSVFDSDQMILVGRLDGPNPEVVRRMMREAVETEEKRLVGRVCLDLRGINDPKDPYSQGDTWLKATAISFRKHGFTTDQDTRPALFPDWLPWNQVGVYLGWYEGNAMGPFMKRLCFAPGAIAYHIHSTSASTLRSNKENWAGPLLTQGATATMGCVYEPYLDMTPHLDLFTKKLLEGYSFGEAAYACQKYLSWMTTVVGDPLYTPFRKPLTEAIEEARERKTDRLPWLEMQRRNVKLVEKPESFSLDLLSDLSSIEGNPWVLEEAGDLLMAQKGYKEGALTYYERAYLHAALAVDRIRVGCKIARLTAILGNWDRAYGILIELAKRDPEEFQKVGGVTMLKMIAGFADAPAVPVALEFYLKVESGVYDIPF